MLPPTVRSIETLEIACGAYRAQLLTLGATLRMLEAPDRHGVPANVVLGYGSIDDYVRHPRLYGAVAGRYANRIAGACFSLEGSIYRLAANDGTNSLHSGPLGFDQRHWDVLRHERDAVTFGLVSPAGDGGFPGTLQVSLTYTMTDTGLLMQLSATTDAPTVVNLTHHAYFNLAGEASGVSVEHHWLQIPASRYTPINGRLIPTGELRHVEGTPFDFRRPKPIGRDLHRPDEQMLSANGYDHNLAIDTPSGTLRRVATAFEPGSGRVLEVHSTEPGLQLYTGNDLGGGQRGASGRVYARHDGLCLEPQKFPDSPNQAHFPSAVLRPDEVYSHDIAFRFRTADAVEKAFAD